MSNQVQCPNCGGYKITSAEVPITGKMPVPIWSRVVGAIVGLALVGAGFIISSGIGSYSGKGDSDLAWVCWLPGALILLPSLLVSTQPKKVGKYYTFSCLLCGYQWEWREGQQWPKVKVNPDLIAKGAQKLEQEEEQRRKQQEDAAALYHLTHQGKK